MARWNSIIGENMFNSVDDSAILAISGESHSLMPTKTEYPL